MQTDHRLLHVNGSSFLLHLWKRVQLVVCCCLLQSLLTDEQVANAPILVLGNKIDKPGAASEDEIRHWFGLHNLTTGKVSTQCFLFFFFLNFLLMLFCIIPARIFSRKMNTWGLWWHFLKSKKKKKISLNVIKYIWPRGYKHLEELAHSRMHQTWC